MPRRSILDDEQSPDIDLSPMIDCIFILLIFFIVATVFVEESGVQASKPDAAAAATTLEEDTTLVLQITAENEILLDGREVALADVPSSVKAHVQGKETPVVVRASEKAHHGTFVAVWDAALRGGAETLSFQTVN